LKKVIWRRNPEDVGRADTRFLREALIDMEGWALIGAAAVLQYAPGRLTYDLDIACLPEAYLPVVQRLRKTLGERGEAMAFRGRWELFRRGLRFRTGHVDVLMLRADVADDLFPNGLPSEKVGGVPVLARPELCLLKMTAARQKDLADAARLVRTMTDRETRRARRLIAEVLGEDALAAFDEIVELQTRPLT